MQNQSNVSRGISRYEVTNLVWLFLNDKIMYV